MVAAMNLSIKGRSRFERSQGAAGEAMKGNPSMPVILRVDAVKFESSTEDDRNQSYIMNIGVC